MIKGVGIDIVKIERITKVTQKWKDRFEEKILTPGEKECGRSRKKAKLTYLAGRFAAKEAVRKSLGVPIDWQDIEILPEKNGKPSVNLRGKAKRVISEKGVKQVMVSLSHDGDYVIAQAVTIGD